MIQFQTSGFHVLVEHYVKISQEVFRLKMFTHNITQLCCNIIGLRQDTTYATDQTMFTNCHSKAVNPFLHFWVGFIEKQKARNCLPAFTQPVQSDFCTISYSMGQALNMAN